MDNYTQEVQSTIVHNSLLLCRIAHVNYYLLVLHLIFPSLFSLFKQNVTERSYRGIGHTILPYKLEYINFLRWHKHALRITWHVVSR